MKGKIKLRSKKGKEKPDAAGEEPRSLTLLSDADYQEKQLEQHRKEGTLVNYIELLHTQIGSLVEKLLSLTEKPPWEELPSEEYEQFQDSLEQAQKHIKNAINAVKK